MLSEAVKEILDLPDYCVDEDNAASILIFWPIIERLLNIFNPVAICGIGAERDHSTRHYLKWCKTNNKTIYSVGPTGDPQAFDDPHIKICKMLSLDFLRNKHEANFYILDGDHCYETLSQELSLIDDNWDAQQQTCVLLHNISWPYGNTDAVAQKYGVANNGVLNAIEDFLALHPERWDFFKISCFNGLGLLWRESTLSVDKEDALQDFLKSIALLKPLLSMAETNRLRLYQGSKEQEDDSNDLQAKIKAMVPAGRTDFIQFKTEKTMRMRIAVVSKADSSGGGASKCAEQLHLNLMEQGHYATHFCGYTRNGWTPSKRPLSLFPELHKTAHLLNKRIGLPELIPFELPTLLHQMEKRHMMLAHFHDISSFISPLSLYFLAKKLPVVWTIHDCSPATGGCLYPMGCKKYLNGCRNGCPNKGEWPIDNYFVFTGILRSIKKFVHTSPDLHCITPSQWMADFVESTGITKNKVKVIPNAVDLQSFHALDKLTLRHQLGLPTNRLIILVSASDLKSPRKGVKQSIDVLRTIKDLSPLVLIMGVPPLQGFNEMMAGLEYRHCGYLKTDTQLNQAYSAADLFLFCSLADNQPLSVIESLASGTPVFAFATGGIPESIRNGQTGCVVSPGNVADLAQAIRDIHNAGKLAEWSRAGRLDAEQRFAMTRYVDDHLQYYQELIERSKYR